MCIGAFKAPLIPENLLSALGPLKHLLISENMKVNNFSFVTTFTNLVTWSQVIDTENCF